MIGTARRNRNSAAAPLVVGTMALVTMYTTTWCGYCYRLKSQLTRAGVAYDEVDIERQPAAADLVASVNDGNQTVPTLVFSDGTALTNPSATQVRERLASLVA